MDGREYVSAFVRGGMSGIDLEGDITREGLRSENHDDLTRKIGLLHGIGEVHCLTDEPAPYVVGKADETLHFRAETREVFGESVQVREAAMRHAGMSKVSDRITIIRLPYDMSATLDPQELRVLVDAERQHLADGLVTYSDWLLSRAVKKISRRTGQTEPTHTQIAKDVKETICGQRPELTRVVEPFRGIITIERDFTLVHGSKPGSLVAMRVSNERHGKRVPAWIPEVTEWQDPIHRLCSAISEIETIIALQEWVVARNLAHLPIVAPGGYEQGDLAQPSRGNNARADALLCCLLPDRNEIIPIQVKNLVTQRTREEYHPGVVLIGAKELGLETISTCMVKDNGRTKTGLRATTAYGRILELYLTNHGRGNASKSARTAYKAALQPAFEFFDRVIVEQMQSNVPKQALTKIKA